jgi:hypothetical protein
MLEDSNKKYGIYELGLYFACGMAVSIIFHRFAGVTWFGKNPATGAVIVLLLAAIPIALGASTGLNKTIRLGVPIVLVYLFYAQTQEMGFIEGLQSRVGFPHFLIVAVCTFLAVYFTERAEQQAQLLGSETPAYRPRKSVSDPQQAFDRIVGQEHVIAPLKEIAKIVRSGIRVGKRNAPHAVLLFLGPTGVGKTEAATALAEAVYGTKDALIRFDMGQFTDAHQANRFYGPPPGYVGYEEGGQLTRAVMRKPHSVVLLDEVEKAHPQIWDAFLPVFDEGYIVDGSSNQKIDMTNTIIVLTSNLLADKAGLSQLAPYQLKEAVQASGAFRPELLGRINEILVFNPLSSEVVAEILKRRLDAALWSLADQGISVSVGESEINVLVEEVKSVKFGVRQIDDVVRKFLRQAIAKSDGGDGPKD